MAESIRAYGLGTGGVDLVKSPLHLDDNEVIQAQNAEPYRERGQTGIRKRPAYRPINASATAAIQGLLAVELAQGGAGNNLGSDGISNDIAVSGVQGLVLVARHTQPGTQAWKYTINGGSTWATTTALTKNIGNNDHSAVVYQGRAFYAGEDDSIGEILCFDGATEFEFSRLPFGPSAATAGATKTNALGMAMGKFYFANNNAVTGRVYEVDPVTGAATMVGTTFDSPAEVVVDVVAYAGRVWVCTFSGTGVAVTHIYSIRPGIDTAWTTERTTVDLGGAKFLQYMSLQVLDGNLYAATSAPAGFAAVIERRTPAGVWSTELTSADVTNVNYYDSLFIWNEVLYVMFAGGAVFNIQIQASVGSWSIDKDMAAAGSTETWGFLATPDLLYASGPPRVYTKSGAVWSTSLSDASLTHGLLI